MILIINSPFLDILTENITRNKRLSIDDTIIKLLMLKITPSLDILTKKISIDDTIMKILILTITPSLDILAKKFSLASLKQQRSRD